MLATLKKALLLALVSRWCRDGVYGKQMCQCVVEKLLVTFNSIYFKNLQCSLCFIVFISVRFRSRRANG
jgi:hypothetical protein